MGLRSHRIWRLRNRQPNMRPAVLRPDSPDSRAPRATLPHGRLTVDDQQLSATCRSCAARAPCALRLVASVGTGSLDSPSHRPAKRASSLYAASAGAARVVSLAPKRRVAHRHASCIRGEPRPTWAAPGGPASRDVSDFDLRRALRRHRLQGIDHPSTTLYPCAIQERGGIADPRQLPDCHPSPPARLNCARRSSRAAGSEFVYAASSGTSASTRATAAPGRVAFHS